ncbi:MAG: DUF3160 domain-containing protein, partial [Spirochaetia bacterium]
MRAGFVVLVVAAAGLLASCGKATGPASTARPGSAAAAGGGQAAAGAVKLNTSNFRDIKIDSGPFSADAHHKYLSDPLTFADVPDQGIGAAATAVVGSKVCMFYPNAEMSGAGDLAKLPAGIPVPFGTIIPIKGEQIADPNSDHGGMFSFQDNWNWFYRTTFKGQEGLVFGADLYGLGYPYFDNRVSALLYKNGGRSDQFYPLVGYHPLSSVLVSRLQRDKLAIQSVNKAEYPLSADRPDDMISLFMELSPGDWYSAKWNRKSAVFVTTDIAAHAQHLMFDRLLQYLEETFFVPRLKALTAGFLQKLKAREPGAASYRESLDKARLYFQVAQALLDLAPARTEGQDKDGHQTVT